MKNCISRRSFLKAAGILGAAGALAACGGSSASTSTAASTAGSTAASAAASSTSIKLWTYPIGGWGNDETVQGLVSSLTQSILTSRSLWSIWTTPTATIR